LYNLDSKEDDENDEDDEDNEDDDYDNHTDHDKISIHKGLLKGPNEDSASSFSSFKLLRNLQQRITTARRVLFDNFNSCSQKRKGQEHEVFFQLPIWETVSDYGLRDTPQEGPPQLFFTRCSATTSEGNDWCHARMHLLP
jgi:hypothetical protein